MGLMKNQEQFLIFWFVKCLPPSPSQFTIDKFNQKVFSSNLGSSSLSNEFCISKITTQHPAPAHLASHTVFVFVFFVFVFSKITTQHRLTTSAAHSMQCLHLFENIVLGGNFCRFCADQQKFIEANGLLGDTLKIKRPTCSKSYQVQYKTNTELHISR